jgi:hypothetical protein
MLEDTAPIRISSDFTIELWFHPNVIGGKQALFSKRAPVSTGNRPGLTVFLHGSMVKMMTYEDGGKGWITTASYGNPKQDPRLVCAGEACKVYIFRSGGNARIYINGIDRTMPKYKTCCPGDLNVPVDMFLGCQFYDKPEIRDVFDGTIHAIEYYDQAYLNRANPVRFPKNPFAFPLWRAPEKIPQAFKRGSR